MATMSRDDPFPMTLWIHFKDGPILGEAAFSDGAVRDALHEERADAWREDGAAAHALRA